MRHGANLKLLNVAVFRHPIDCETLHSTFTGKPTPEDFIYKPTSFYWWLENHNKIKNAIDATYQIAKANSKRLSHKKKSVHLAIEKSINNTINDEFGAIETTISDLNLSSYCPKEEEIETATPAKRSAFIIYALLLGFFETIGGIAGMYMFIDYICKSAGIHLIVPAAAIVSLLFGFVSASVAAVFDIVAVANAMKVPYLTACKELKILVSQSHQLIELNRQIKTALNQLHESIAPDADLNAPQQACAMLTTEFLKLTKIQSYVTNRITEYERQVELTRTKRIITKLCWVALASPIYAGTIVIAADAALLLLPTFGFPPAGIIIGAIFAAFWVVTELFRFWSFERHNMNLGIDALFGSPLNKLGQMFINKNTMTKKLERNQALLQKVSSRIDQQSEAQEKLASLEKENATLLETKTEQENQITQLTHKVSQFENTTLFRAPKNDEKSDHTDQSHVHTA